MKLKPFSRYKQIILKNSFDANGREMAMKMCRLSTRNNGPNAKENEQRLICLLSMICFIFLYFSSNLNYVRDCGRIEMSIGMRTTFDRNLFFLISNHKSSDNKPVGKRRASFSHARVNVKLRCEHFLRSQRCSRVRSLRL